VHPIGGRADDRSEEEDPCESHETVHGSARATEILQANRDGMSLSRHASTALSVKQVDGTAPLPDDPDRRPSMPAPRDDLRLLSIFHYILAGMAALFSLFPVFHLAVGVAMITGQLTGPRREAMFGWVLVAIGSALILSGLAYAVLVALAGRYIGTQRHWIYCMVIAGLSCVFFPLGTVLGVFTLVVLSKPDVRALFQAEAPPGGRASPPSTWMPPGRPGAG
jgi:hypothetical protein